MTFGDSTENRDPSLREFLEAPLAEAATVAPTSMIYSVSGTRRSAALAGEQHQGKAYVQWSRERMMACLEVLFAHGVQHVIMPVITPSQFMEATPAYREHLWAWLEEGLAGPEALAEYARRGWRVRMPFWTALPQMHNAGERMEKETAGEGAPSLWVFVAPHHNFFWEQALARGRLAAAGSTEEAVRLLYGADIPPATLYLDFGKPVFSPDVAPPFLAGVMHCYWTQKPGYSLDEAQWRRILYDYAFTRPTWREDKQGRAEKALAHEDVWQQEVVLGLGRRLGPFWYPLWGEEG